MLTCEELAKEIFIADNNRLTREQAERVWAEFQGPDITEYAHNIAAGLMPILAKVWDEGYEAGDSDGYNAAKQEGRGIEQDTDAPTPNPYRKATP